MYHNLSVEDLYQHYLTLCKSGAWKAYAWHRVQQLTKDDSGLYADFEERIKKELQGAANEPQQKP